MAYALDSGVKLIFSYGSTGRKNSFGIVYGRSTPAALNSPELLVGAAFSSGLVDALLDVLSVEARLFSLYAYALSPGQAVAYREPALSTAIGTASGVIAPSNLSGVISLIQGETTSKANGRIFVGGFNEGDLGTPGSFVSGFVTRLGAFATALESGLLDFVPCVVTRQYQSAPITPALHPVTEAIVRSAVRQQRRRVTAVDALVA